MTDAQSVRIKLEAYARTKIASVLQPMTELMLIEQPVDPVAFMVRYLASNRSDLRGLVGEEILKVAEESGQDALPAADHPLLDRIEAMRLEYKALDKARRKLAKHTSSEKSRLEARVAELENIIKEAGLVNEKEGNDSEWIAFESWDQLQLANSIPDVKDTEDFRYRTYLKMPPYTSKHQSLVSKILTKEHWARLRNQITPRNFTFSNLIQSSVLSRAGGGGGGDGLLCGDEDCFRVFTDLITAVVRARHGVDPAADGTVSMLSALADAAAPALQELRGQWGITEETRAWKRHVTAVHVTVKRNVAGYMLPAGADAADRASVEALLRGVLVKLEGDLAGEYLNIDDLDPDDEDSLTDRGLLYRRPDPAHPLHAGGAARDWPRNRGIFYTAAASAGTARSGTSGSTGDSRGSTAGGNPGGGGGGGGGGAGGVAAACWVNGGGDHCVIVSQDDDDLAAALCAAARVHEAVVAGLRREGKEWMRDPAARLGYLAAAPTDLGLAFSAAATLRLPTSGQTGAAAALAQACAPMGLQVDRVVEEEGSAAAAAAAAAAAKRGGEEMWRVCTAQKFHVTEVQLATALVRGVYALTVAAEKLK